MAERRREGKTIRRIRRAVGSQQLGESFTAAAVNEALDITWVGTFLWKHRIGNGQTTELFERVGVAPIQRTSAGERIFREKASGGRLNRRA